MESPIVGINIPITRSIKEENLVLEDLYQAKLLDENEYYRVYDNGVLVRIKLEGIPKLIPHELPMGEYPNPSYPIPKGK